MSGIIRDTRAMIASMEPALRPGIYAFVSLTNPDHEITASAIASFKEDEGLSLILPVEAVPEHVTRPLVEMHCITLTVNSSLEGIGLTAAVGTALADAGIAVNVVAATHHDHLFVPARDADRAVECLRSLQASVDA